MRFLVSIGVLLLLLVAGAAGAQQRPSYVQIEAHPSLRIAEQRARDYGSLVPSLNGFGLPGGWYGLTLGPFDEATAREELRRLRRDGLIPRDSYVTDGRGYRDRFWPLGVTTGAEVAVLAPENAPSAVVAPQPAAPSTDSAVINTAPATPEQVQPEVVVVPEETRQEARRSEARLSRAEREDLQRALEWFGLYTSGIDGDIGPGTRRSMSAWQERAGLEVTGVLTTRQRARLIEEFRAAQAALGLQPLDQAEAGLSLTAPLGLVEFDRIEAPFVHYRERDGSGIQLSLISQAGDRAALGGLYEILQTLDVVPTEGERGKQRDSFRITGLEAGRTTQVFAKLADGKIFGYLLSWPDGRAPDAARAIEAMEATLISNGPALDPDEGFDPATQSFDMVSGLEVRQPLRSASGFFVDGAGRVVTAAANVAACGRVTLDRLHDARVIVTENGIAVLEPEGRLAPAEIGRMAPAEGRLRSTISVGGFPFGGVLGAATLSFGTLEDVRGLDGSEQVLRLSLSTRDGDVGGPVLDGAGRVAGMLLPPLSDASRALPGDVAFAAKASAVSAVLQSAGVAHEVAASSGTLASEDLTTRATGMTVLVSCWE